MTPYFGFGALMNQISLRMRGVYPRSSAAAKLVGFRLVFSGSHGMATVLRSSAADAVYGVLHMVSAEEKQRLESSESSYEAVEAEESFFRLAGLEGLTFAINGKIFRVAPDAPSHVKRQVMIYGAGKDHTWAVAQEYYEPLHGEPRSLEALTEAHRAFCEHQLVMQYCGPTAGCACGICPIGWLK
eukprot:g33693.t1